MLRSKRRPTVLPSAKLCLEGLEDRNLLSANVLQTNLVSDLPGVAQFLDPNLVNPWGIAESTTSPFWVSDNNAGVSTLYNTAGMPQSLVVSIPSPGDPTGASGTPTGTVFNTAAAAGAFKLPNGKPASFIFATEDGTIVAWNGGTEATIVVDNSQNPSAAEGAVYKGLAIATDANGRTLLYATNFRSGRIDVFDTSFAKVNSFTDPDLPKGYAPFGIQELGGKVYVTYAKQDADKHDDVAGPGHGFVDVFNLDGSGEQRLISRGPLDSPWGLAIAPGSFGSLAGALLVGNFGNGHINAFDAKTGAFLGELKDPDGEAIQIDGLWGLRVGNGGKGGDANTLYFTAGLDHEQHGLFGSLAPPVAGMPEGLAEEQAVTAALDVFQIDLNIVQQDLSSGVPRAQLRQDLHNLSNALIDLVHAEASFAADARHDAHGSALPGPAHRPHLVPPDGLFADLGRLLHGGD